MIWILVHCMTQFRSSRPLFLSSTSFLSVRSHLAVLANGMTVSLLHFLNKKVTEYFNHTFLFLAFMSFQLFSITIRDHPFSLKGYNQQPRRWAAGCQESYYDEKNVRVYSHSRGFRRSTGPLKVYSGTLGTYAYNNTVTQITFVGNPFTHLHFPTSKSIFFTWQM